MPFSCYSLGTGKVFFICDLDCSMIIILNPFITISDLDIISPKNINSLSSRQFVKRRKKNINYGNIYWRSNNNSSRNIWQTVQKELLARSWKWEGYMAIYKSYLFLFQLRKACKKAIILSGIIGQSIRMYFCSTLSRQISFRALNSLLLKIHLRNLDFQTTVLFQIQKVSLNLETCQLSRRKL